MRELLDELYRFRLYTSAFQGLLKDAQARAPQSSEGTDSSLAVRAQIGCDGQLESVHISPGWQHKLSPEAFSSAVLEAFQAAVAAQLKAWSRSLEEESWQSKIERLKNDQEKQPPPTARASHSAHIGDYSRDDITPRGLDEVVEDVIKAADSIQTLTRTPPKNSQVSASSANGMVKITLSRRGLESCTVDPRWVSRQSGPRLTAAIGDAIAQARAGLARIESDAQSAIDFAGLDRLLSETLFILNKPQRFAGP